jgi:hypothetical protein
MISIGDQNKLLIQIGNKLPEEITIYAIGGTAMMFLGLKDVTKDIDLVFTDKKERKMFKEAAISLGYKEMDPAIVYGVQNNCPEMITLGTSHFDLFSLEVIDFIFSKNMQERATQIHQFGENLKLKIADKHDIIIMKCATRRMKDEDDIVNIVRNNYPIDWDIIMEEIKLQVSLGKETAFMEMGNLVEKLIYTHKLNVPKSIHDKLFSLLEEQIKRKKDK